MALENDVFLTETCTTEYRQSWNLAAYICWFLVTINQSQVNYNVTWPEEPVQTNHRLMLKRILFELLKIGFPDLWIDNAN